MKRQHLRGVLAVVTMAAGWWLVYTMGESYSAVTHVMYLPVVLAAMAWGWAGGIVSALVAGIVSAPIPVGMAAAQAHAWLGTAVRAGSYLTVGTLVGSIVLRMRWQQRELQGFLIQSVTALTNAMSVNHQQTARHSLRVAEVSGALGKLLHLNENRLFILRMGSLLHDIGKLAVPMELLDKPGRLTPEEFRAVKEHAAAGAAILQAFDYPQVGAISDIVRHHHERLDGSGYPDGLCTTEITLLARIVAVADVYDALTSNRSYRSRMAHAEAMAVLRQEALNGRLDGRVVELLEKVPAVLTDRRDAMVEVPATEAV